MPFLWRMDFASVAWRDVGGSTGTPREAATSSKVCFVPASTAVQLSAAVTRRTTTSQ